MELIIDNRETSIKDYFIKKNLDYIKYENLDLGDFIFKYNEEVLLIIERKTLEDLASSIKDGRYREQKARLIANYPLSKIMYIIEGDLTKENKSINFNKVNKYTIYSSIINMYIRDNLNVFESSCLDSTIEFIENLSKKLNKQGIKFINKRDNYKDDLCKNISTVKKENITREIVYKTQLSSIPSISSNYASVIIEKYPNLVILINSLLNLSKENRINLIRNLEYTKGDKKRKLGKRVAENLIKYIFDDN